MNQSSESAAASPALDEAEVEIEYSPITGGPFFRLLLSLGLAAPSLERKKRRIVALVGLVWIPLLVLSAVRRLVVGGVPLPFLSDVELHLRVLVAFPILIAAETTVHDSFRAVLRLFFTRGILRASQRPQFLEILTKAVAMRDSLPAELALASFALLMSYPVLAGTSPLVEASWIGSPGPAGPVLTLAGWWYHAVSLPLLRFIQLRWLYRFLVGALLFRHVANLELDLQPTHPDRAGGIGFLRGAVVLYVPVLFAFGVIFAAHLSGRIFHAGHSLLQYREEVLCGTVILVSFVLASLLPFVPALIRARSQGLSEYGQLAANYSRAFRQKWISKQVGAEALLGTGDIQTLADLEASYAVIGAMRPFPVDTRTVVRLAAMMLLPIAPLMLTVIPLPKLIEKLIKMML